MLTQVLYVRVREAVGTDCVAFNSHSTHQLGVGLNIAPNTEKGGLDVEFGKDIEHEVSRSDVRAVVEGQRYALVVAPPSDAPRDVRQSQPQALPAVTKGSRHVAKRCRLQSPPPSICLPIAPLAGGDCT